MKVFVIDPFNKTIEEADYDGDYKSIYALGDFQIFEVVTFNRHSDGVFLDEEGLFKDDQRFFMIEGYPQPLAGKGVVLGCDDMGASTSPHVTMEWLQNNVRFQP